MHSELASRSQTRAVLERFGLYTKHRLGQNFLVEDSVIARIGELAQLAAGDVVLEVGPGIGTLTVAMLGAAPVVAVEADTRLAPVLAETCAADSERLEVIWGDALKVPADDVCAAAVRLGADAGPTKLVSNLPYQVAATVILGYLEALPTLGRAVVMVQAEVADRICASPGSKAYGAYTAKLALLGQVTGRFEVSPGCFMPAPHVDSAVVRIDRADALAGTGLAFDDVARVIDAAFAQRRKTIRNSMGASGFAKDALDAAFAAVGIEATCRAETLAPADFIRLAQALGEAGER